MKKFIIHSILACAGLLITSIVSYIFFALYLPIELKDIILPINLEFIGSLALGSLLVILGLIFEDRWIQEKKRVKLKDRFELLISLIKRIFTRRESEWNFLNESGTFYFDSSNINSLYELLISQNREWEAILIESRNNNVNQNKLSKKSFIIYGQDGVFTYCC